MATSGNTRLNVSPDGQIYLLFNWSLYAQDINANTSTVKWSLQLISAKAPYNIMSSQPKACKVTIDGKALVDTTVNVGVEGGKSKTLTSGEVSITHDSDGTKIFNYSFSQEFNINYSGSQITTKIGQGAGSLTTIPRATTPSTVTTANFGTEITINTPRASTNFTHKLIYVLNDAKGIIAEKVTTSYKWTIPLDLMNQIPNALKGVISIRCETYNGSVYVGAKSIKLTVNVPSNIVPTISSVTFTEAVVGIASKFKAFVKDNSKVTANITASGVYGSTITNYSSTLLNVTYKGKTFTSGLITQDGTVPVVITVTDSRGRKTTTTKKLTVLDYYAPKITRFNANRCNSSGVLKDDGEHIKIDFTIDICSVNSLNDKGYRIDYRESDNTTYTTIESGNAYSVNKSIITNAIANVDNTYRVRLTVNDFFNTGIAFEVDIPTSFSLIDFSTSGKGIAFGESANNDNFTVAMTAHFKKAIILDDVSLIDGLKETEWIYLTLDPKFKPYTDTQVNTPRYRRRGKVVDIRGVIQPVAQMASNYTQVKFAGTLPEELRPSESIYQLCTSRNKETWTLTISKDGNLYISEYGINAYGNIPTNARCVFQVTYTID